MFHCLGICGELPKRMEHSAKCPSVTGIKTMQARKSVLRGTRRWMRLKLTGRYRPREIAPAKKLAYDSGGETLCDPILK